ncbi:protein Njmu-R1-like [Hydractinia symbiolongicarpus]|uniref:protein Njmu-R1-like n=1 Tax=Hydractinia symbiolongicarpus TaxID=13093 RepID=UPI002549DD32|nr:protein Njmu-R1-like [Hydractinia symbiolongicarpus]
MTTKMATADTKTMSVVREKMLHWHTVYKVSSISSPMEDYSMEISEEKTYPIVNAAKRLSLLSSNMQAEEETMLRSFLASKLNKNEEISYESVVLSIEPNYFVQDVPTQIYYKAITRESGGAANTGMDAEKTDVFIVCFVASALSGLEMFQADLDNYCNSLMPYLEKYMESVDISEYLKLLESWYETNICFVERCLTYFSDDLSTLICAGFCGDSVTVDENISAEATTDIQRFLKCCSLSQLFLEKSSSKTPSSSSLQDLATLDSSHAMKIRQDQEGNYIIDGKRSTTFCEECIKAMQALTSGHPIKMRQLLENYKLKSIQDMNTFKRLINQSETDYYTLYKTYVFLITCGNGVVLLRNAKLQNSFQTIRTTKQVIDVLESFIHRLGGFGVIDTNEKKLELNAKLAI